MERNFRASAYQLEASVGPDRGALVQDPWKGRTSAELQRQDDEVCVRGRRAEGDGSWRGRGEGQAPRQVLHERQGKLWSSSRLAALNTHMDCRMVGWARSSSHFGCPGQEVGRQPVSLLEAQRPAALRNVVRRSKEKVGVSFRLGFGAAGWYAVTFFRSGRAHKKIRRPSVKSVAPGSKRVASFYTTRSGFWRKQGSRLRREVAKGTWFRLTTESAGRRWGQLERERLKLSQPLEGSGVNFKWKLCFEL